MSAIWNKGIDADTKVNSFTVGKDKDFDILLAKYDVIGSIAHCKMLCKIGLLTNEELESLLLEMDNILAQIECGNFIMNLDSEDIHSNIELLLTQKLGDLGKKIHSGRSRNDQVLVDIKLYFKEEIHEIYLQVKRLFCKLLELAECKKAILLPGYTHTQIAMPSSFGLWFSGYAETLVEDLYLLEAAYKVVDNNPLGSAAGFGNSFPLDREFTSELLGFEALNVNSIAAQLSRGKSEKALANAMAAIAQTLNKFANDCIMYMCQNFGFISFPESLTTGSSIMPHKKNPDVWELIRAHCNRIISVPNEIALLSTNLPHSYHRDFQLLKEINFPAIEKLKECIDMTTFMLENIKVNEDILNNKLYDYMFSVEEVNKRVLEGKSFRDSYVEVGKLINSGNYVANKMLEHCHIGSINNLRLDLIQEKFDQICL